MANEEKKIVYVLLEGEGSDRSVIDVFSSANSAKMYLLEECNSKEYYKDAAVTEKLYADGVRELTVTFTFCGQRLFWNKSVYSLEEHELQGE
jgi:hypothetical protein